MKKARMLRIGERKETKVDGGPDMAGAEHRWVSVMRDAEERMAELRRTIKWAKETPRVLTVGDPKPED